MELTIVINSDVDILHIQQKGHLLNLLEISEIIRSYKCTEEITRNSQINFEPTYFNNFFSITSMKISKVENLSL